MYIYIYIYIYVYIYIYTYTYIYIYIYIRRLGGLRGLRFGLHQGRLLRRLGRLQRHLAGEGNYVI